MKRRKTSLSALFNKINYNKIILIIKFIKLLNVNITTHFHSKWHALHPF